MTLSKQERTIAIVVGSVVGLIVIYLILTNLYLGPLADTQKKIVDARTKLKQESAQLEEADKDNADWEKMGILSDPAAMGEQVHDAVSTIAARAGLQISNWNAATVMRPVTKTDYQEATFKASFKGNSGGFAQFLYTLESSHTPMRVDEMTIAAAKPGVDELNQQLTLTALIYSPKPEKGTPSKPASAKTGTGTKPATKPAVKPGQKTDAQILADMEAARNKALAAASAPATAPAASVATAPATAPATTKPN